MLARRAPQRAARRPRSSRKLDDELRARVHEVVRLTPKIVEVVVRAPMAARAFQPGQFYRLQNYETLAPRSRRHDAGDGRPGADRRVGRSRARDLLSTIVLEMGGSSDLCSLLRPGEPVILMGPTGTPTEMPGGETVVLVGGGLGNAVLFSIGQALRAAGSTVLYFAGYKKLHDRYKVEEIEAPPMSWCGAATRRRASRPARPQDETFIGNIVEAMAAYGDGGDSATLADCAWRSRPPDRHRLGRDDGGGGGGAARRA